MAQINSTLPLTDEDKFHLQTVYGTRLRLFLSAYAGVTVLSLLSSLRAFSASTFRMEYLYLVWGLFGIIIVGTGLWIFLKRVYCLKRDILSGEKELIFFTITQKLYFEHSGEYFFSFDNPKYMHHKVEKDIYYKFEIGDEVGIYRSIYSKFVFEKDFRFTLM